MLKVFADFCRWINGSMTQESEEYGVFWKGSLYRWVLLMVHILLKRSETDAIKKES